MPPWDRYSASPATTPAQAPPDGPWARYSAPPPSPSEDDPPQSGGQLTTADLVAGRRVHQRTPSEQRAYDEMHRTLLNPNIAMAGQGASLGWSDELDAEATRATTALGNLVHRARGEDIPFSSQEAHDAALDTDRESIAEYRRTHPNFLGVTAPEAAGAFLTPWGEAAAALKVLGASSPFLRALLLGGIAGGGAAAGNSTGGAEERLREVPVGATIGAVTGGALHGGGVLLSSSPVRRLGSAVSEGMSRIAQNFGHEPGAPLSPAQIARGQRVGTEQVASMAQRLDPTGERLAASEAEARGAPVTSAEALGREAETQLKAAGRRSGTTPDALETLLSERANGTPHRIVDDFAEITGTIPEEVEGNFAAQAQRLREAATPIYEQAYGYNGIVGSDALANLTQRPSMQRAMRAASEIVREEGGNPEAAGFFETNKGAVRISNPTMRTWDYIKRALDDELDQFRNPITRRLDNLGARGRAILDTLNRVRDGLTDPATPWGPNYAAALDAGGEPLRLESAFREASKLMSNTVRMSDFERRISSFTPAQMEAIRTGIVADARTRAMSGRMRLRDMTTRAYEEKLMRIFGMDRGSQLIQRIRDEQFLLTHGRRMQPGIGSDTSETLLADREQQEATQTAGRALGHAVRGHGVEAILTVLADPIAGMWRGAQLPMNRATRDALGELLMLPPSQLAQVLKQHAIERGLPGPTDENVRRLITHLSTAATSGAAADAAGNNTREHEMAH